MKQHVPGGDRASEIDEFDPAAEGAIHGLAALVAEQIWLIIRAETADGAIEDTDAIARFHQVARRVATRSGQLEIAPGRVTRFDAETFGRDPLTDVFRQSRPGRHSRVEAELARWSRRLRAARPSANDRDLAPDDATAGDEAATRPGKPQLRVVPGGRKKGRGGLPTSGPNQSLPADVVSELTAALGEAARQARIHTGPDAEDLAAAHGAHAITFGEDVFFARGTYQPETAEGRELIAHEVTHVAQSLRGEPVWAAAKSASGASSGAGEGEAEASIAIDIDKISGGYLKGELKAATGAGGKELSGECQIVKGPLKGVVEKIKVSYNLTTKELKGQFVVAVDKVNSILPKGIKASGTLTFDIKKAPTGITFDTKSTVDVKVESLLGGKIKDVHAGDGFGATFLPDGDYKIGAAAVTFLPGTTLTVDSKTGITGKLKGSVQIGSLPKLELEVQRTEAGLDVHVSTEIDLADINSKLGGKVRIDYIKGREGGGALGFVADAPRIKDIPNGDLLAKLEGGTDGKDVTGRLQAKKGATFEYQKVKGTVQKGELMLLPGKKLEGDLEGSVEAKLGEGKFTLGYHDGVFSWNAKGKVNLGVLTNNVLIGEVEAEAGSEADTTFQSKGISFGKEPLKAVKITELSGNLTKKTFSVGVDFKDVARKIEGKIPGVDLNFGAANAKIAYDGTGVKIDGVVAATAKVMSGGKEIASGSAQVQLAENQFSGEINVDQFKISNYLKGNGLVLQWNSESAGVKSGTVEFDAPKLAKGTVTDLLVDLKAKKFGFDAQIDFVTQQKLIAGTKLHIALKDGVLSGDAKFKNEYVGGSLELTRGGGTTSFKGRLDPKLGGLGKIGENFLGAEISYTTGQGLTAKGGFSLNGLSNMIGNDSKIELSYANNKLAVDGTLHAGKIQHVEYIGQNELKIHWEQGGKLSVRGQVDATVANLADVSLKVASGPQAEGSGEADLDANTPRFYLSGKITSKGLQKYFPNVKFSEPSASVHVENRADGHWDYAIDEITTNITGINGLDEANVALKASYAKGKGISASATINKLRYKQFSLTGKFSITDNKVDPATLGMEADFAAVKLRGDVNVSKSELGGLSWKTHVEAVPTEGGPLAWVKSGSIDASMVNGKLTEAKGTLELKPPSFLPIEKPTLTVGYNGTDIVGTLEADFSSPLHKTAKGKLKLTIGGPEKFVAEIRMPAKLPGMKEAEIYGTIKADGSVQIGADLEPAGLPFVKKAKIYVRYQNGAFVVGGGITLAPTDDLELDIGVEYDITNKQFHIKGMEPKHEDKEKDKPLATIKHDKHFPSIPLFGIGVLNVVLTMRLGMGVNINKPFIKFNTPKLIGGLEALESGQMPAIEFGGKIGMGAEMFVEFGVGIAGQIQLLIAKAEMGLEGVLKAGLTMNLQSDIQGKFEHGKPLELTLDPSVSAALKLTASLNAFLFAEVLWWTIIDKKWPLAEMTLADVPLGEFHPFDPFKLKLGGGTGTSVETPKIKEDQSQMKEGAKNAAQAANDEVATKETKDKVRPVLARIRQVAKRFETLPEGWQGKGLNVAPVEFDSWYGIDKDKWDTYREVADNAEAMVPEEACKTPTEKLSKAVAVLSKVNPIMAGMLVLQWQRAQIAALGINPDTGEDVVAKQKEIEALVANDYANAMIAWQAQVEAQKQAHANAVTKQGVDFAAAEKSHDQRTEQTKSAFNQQTQKADQDLQAQKDKLASVQGAPPPPPAPPAQKPVAPPAAKLKQPDAIPVPVDPPPPAPPAPVPAVTLPALPADPGASAPSAARIPPAKAPAPVPAPVTAPPNPAPAPSSVAAASGGKSATARGGGGGAPPGGKGGGAQQGGGGGGGGGGAPGPAVVAGPQGIIVQDKSLEQRRSTLGKGGAAPAGAKPGAAPAAPAGAKAATPAAPTAPAPAAGPAPAAPAAPGGAPAPGGPAAKPGDAPAAPAGGSQPDATVQKVVDAGKADADKQKQEADAKAAAHKAKTDAEKKQVADAEAKAKEAQAAAANAPASGVTPPTPPAAPGADGKDGAPKPADAAKPTTLGEAVPFSVFDEAHKLYIEGTVPMVQSTPTKADAKIAELKADIDGAKSIKDLAAASVQQANAAHQALVTTIGKAGADTSAATAVVAHEKALAAPLKATWEWAKVAKEPAVLGGSIDKPLTHPYYPTFKERVAKLSSLGHITTVDAGAFAESTWTKICAAVKAATPMMTDPKAYSNFAKGWLDMKSPQFLQAIKEFDAVTKEIAKAATNQFATAKDFGFWSKDEGRALSESISGLTLETSAIGKLMDGLPTLDGKKAGWDPEVWGALSNAYATAVVPEILKGKKVNVCLGAGVQDGNIWQAVESVALTKGLRGTKESLESATRNYGAAAKSKANRKELDPTKTVGGHKGCVFAGDGTTRTQAMAAADAHFNSLPDAAPQPGAAPGTPPPPATAVAPAPGTPPPAAPAPAVAGPGAPAPAPVTPPSPGTPAAAPVASATPTTPGTAPATPVAPGAAPAVAPATPPPAAAPPTPDNKAQVKAADDKIKAALVACAHKPASLGSMSDTDRIALAGKDPAEIRKQLYPDWAAFVGAMDTLQKTKVDQLATETGFAEGTGPALVNSFKEKALASFHAKGEDISSNFTTTARGGFLFKGKPLSEADLAAALPDGKGLARAVGSHAIAANLLDDKVTDAWVKYHKPGEEVPPIGVVRAWAMIRIKGAPVYIRDYCSPALVKYPGWVFPEPAIKHDAVFSDYCDLLALYANWFPQGQFRMTLKRAGVVEAIQSKGLRKPTVFDGMQSPLWVQRDNRDHNWGVTGGGLREALMEIKWDHIDHKKWECVEIDAKYQAVLDAQNKGPAATAGDKAVVKGHEDQQLANAQATQAAQTQADTTAAKPPGAGSPPSAPPAPSTPATPAVSKHAAGPPPSGWQGNVLKSVPSTDVAPDDPGHTYHLLKDGKGVATTEPSTLAPGTVQGLQNKLRGTVPFEWEVDPKRKPTNFEASARAFETKLAPKAVSKSNDIAGRMCVAALGYMKSKAGAATQGLSDVDKKLDELIALCGDSTKSFAGAVGKDPQVIRQILMTAEQHKAQTQAAKTAGKQLFDAPTIREQMTFIRNFFRQVLSKDLVKEGGAAEAAKHLGAIGETKEKLQQRIARAQAAADAKGKPLENKDVFDAVPPHPGDNVVRTGEGADPDKTAEARNPLAIKHQDKARVDVSDVKDAQDPARVQNQPDRGKRISDDRAAGVGTSTRTVGSQTDFPLSSREKDNMGVSQDSDQLTWNEGDQVWFQNQKNAWVQAIEELQLPFAGGPSGLSNSYLNAVQILLGGAAKEMLEARLALIGHLSHIHAHTAVEVLAAGAGFGLSFTAGPRMYRDIKPLDEEDDLRPCGRPGGPNGKNLFPDEPDPT